MTDTTYLDEGDELREIKAKGHAAMAISNPDRRNATVASLTLDVLVDIAASLRILSTQYGELAPVIEPDDGDDRDPDDEPDPNVNVRSLEVGDWVAPLSVAGTALKGFEPAVITGMGVSEGAEWAMVEGIGRIWLSELMLVNDPAKAELEGVVDRVLDERQALINELDNDFDGEVKPLTKAERKALKAAQAAATE